MIIKIKHYNNKMISIKHNYNNFKYYNKKIKIYISN